MRASAAIRYCYGTLLLMRMRDEMTHEAMPPAAACQRRRRYDMPLMLRRATLLQRFIDCRLMMLRMRAYARRRLRYATLRMLRCCHG